MKKVHEDPYDFSGDIGKVHLGTTRRKPKNKTLPPIVEVPEASQQELVPVTSTQPDDSMNMVSACKIILPT